MDSGVQPHGNLSHTKWFIEEIAKKMTTKATVTVGINRPFPLLVVVAQEIADIPVFGTFSLLLDDISQFEIDNQHHVEEVIAKHLDKQLASLKGENNVST